jgi:hypothetical protein
MSMHSRYRMLAAGAAAFATAVGAAAMGGSGALAAGSTTRYVSTTGTDNAACDQGHPCQQVQHAVDVANPGDTVRIRSGTYVEQVTISKNLNIIGDGVDQTVIKGPDVKTFDHYGQTYIVELNTGATVGMTQLTVKGPSGPGGGLNCAPNPLSLDNGVAVIDNATLTMFNAAVRDIYDVDLSGNQNSGCQRGDAISVGKLGGVDPSLAVPAHANIFDVTVSRFQKDGVAERTAGSTMNLVGDQVVNQPSNVIASNGVELLDGALGNVQYNSVSGNECNLAVICGSDPFNNTESSGILTFASDTNTLIANNLVFANDLGIYTDDNIRVLSNQDSYNRDVGFYVDTDSHNLRAIANTTNKDGSYGVAIGPLLSVDQGGTGKPNAGGNTFVQDTAFGNTKYDLFQSDGSGANHNEDNQCGTAYPSRSYWDCESGSEHGGDGDRDDYSSDGGGGSDNGGHSGGRVASRDE